MALTEVPRREFLLQRHFACVIVWRMALSTFNAIEVELLGQLCLAKKGERIWLGS